MPGQLDDKTKGIIMEAVKAAQEELKEYPNIPENSETMLKYPNMNPKGIYSEIDMDIARRLKKCDTYAKSQDILDRASYADLRKAVFESDRGKKLKAELAKVSKDHRTLTRAARLCKDEKAKAVLLARAEALKNSEVVKNYNLLLDGMARYAGMGKDYISDASIRAYDNLLGYTVTDAPGYNMYKRKERPERITIDLRNTDDLANEFKLSDPGFKGPDNNWFDKVADTYAKDACKDILESRVGKLSDRLDMIIIEGNTLREIIEKKEKDNFKNLTVEQLENLACSYVTAAVKNEDRVEAFVPSDGTKLYDDPVPITGGAPKERVTLNLWERWMSKLGFYKEKVKLVEEQNAKDQAMEECRKRAKEKIGKGEFLNEKDDSGKKRRALGTKIAAKNLEVYLEDARQYEKADGEKLKLRDSFFGEMHVSLINDYNLTPLERDQPIIYAVHLMMEMGYSFEQAIDFRNYPLENVRKQVGQKLKEDFKTMTADQFDQMRLKCVQNLSKEVKPFGEKMSKLIKDEKSLRENYNMLVIGCTCMCVTGMDQFNNKKKIEAQVGAENLRNMVNTLEEVAGPVYRMYSTYRDRFNKYHSAIFGKQMELKDVVLHQLFEKCILGGLKQGKLSIAMDSSGLNTALGVMSGMSEFQKIDQALDAGNEKVLEDVFFKDGGSSMKIKVEGFDSERLNTKNAGGMVPENGVPTKFDFTINDESLYGLADQELENDRTM